MNKEYALVRFTTRTGRVIEVMTAKVKSMLKLMALNRATKSTSAVIVDLENGDVIYGVYGTSKVRDEVLCKIDELGVSLEEIKAL